MVVVLVVAWVDEWAEHLADRRVVGWVVVSVGTRVVEWVEPWADAMVVMKVDSSVERKV